TSEWNSIKAYDSLRQVSQIPSEVIEKMSTVTLLRTVLKYPLLTDVLVYDSYQQGIEHLAKNFSAFPVLINRKDLDVSLLKIYGEYANKNLVSYSGYQKGEHSFQTSFLELLINQLFQKKNNDITYHQAYLQQILQFYKIKREDPETFGRLGLSTGVWAMNRILLADKSSESYAIKDDIIDKGTIFQESIIEKLVQQTETFLSDIKSRTNN
ncbi:MAG: hypothetical protein ABW174_16445, partial [Flavitalea sp.]